jgi:hypothetical protein
MSGRKRSISAQAVMLEAQMNVLPRALFYRACRGLHAVAITVQQAGEPNDERGQALSINWPRLSKNWPGLSGKAKRRKGRRVGSARNP